MVFTSLQFLLSNLELSHQVLPGLQPYAFLPSQILQLAHLILNISNLATKILDLLLKFLQFLHLPLLVLLSLHKSSLEVVELGRQFLILSLAAELIARALDILLEPDNKFLGLPDLLLSLLDPLLSHELVLLLPKLAVPACQFIILLLHDFDHGLIILSLLLKHS